MKQNYRVEVYQDSRSEFRWRIVSHNGKIVADSGEGYTRRAGAERAVEKFCETIANGRYEFAR